jgi:progressive ankylosis protein
MTSVPRVEETEHDAAPAPPQVSTPPGTIVTTRDPASYLSLLMFYLPLGFSGLMMTLDLPIVNGVLIRYLPNPTTSVAALSVAFSLALVYEASHISMIDISTALSSDLRVFGMLRRFYLVVAGTLLVVASLVAFSPLYDLIVRGVMNIPQNVADSARPALWAFLLWPIPIGWRRLYQGALIRHGYPRPVGAGGLVRMGSLLVALLFLGWFGTRVVRLEPAAIAVLAMLVSVTAEAVAVHGWTQRVLRSMPKATQDKPALTYRDLWRFFLPLSATSIMSTLVQPVMRAGIASAAVVWAASEGSEVALASYAVAWSLAALVFGPSLSMTQASIAWSSSPNREVRRRGPRVILSVGVGLALFMAVASFSPFAYWLFTEVLRAPAQIASSAADVARWMVPMPVLHAASYMLRGKHIARHDPKAVRRAQFIDLVAIVAVVLLATGPLAGLFRGLPAPPLAAIAFNLMLCVDIIVLGASLRRGEHVDRQVHAPI